MTQVPPSEPDAQAAGFPGESLVRAREQLGLSAEQVATELRLSPQQVQAIEQSDFSKLPSAVFTRGYIRTYARLVNLDGDELVRQYDRSFGGERQMAPIRTVSKVRPAASSGPITVGSLLLLVVVIVGATFWWWQTQYGHEVTTSPVPETGVAVDTADGETLVFNADDSDDTPAADTVEQSFEAQPQADAGDAPVVSLAVGSLDSASSVAEAPLAQEPEADTPAPPGDGAQEAVAEMNSASPVAPAESVAVSAGLFLRFSDDCWVTVKDASGKTLFNNLRKAGQELHLKQGGPLNVLLGRVSAISEITFDGAVVDLAPYSNKNVARLRVPVAQ